MNRKSISSMIALLFGAMLVVGIRASSTAQGERAKTDNEAFTIDVAENCNTAYLNPVVPGEPPTDVTPGDTIIVSGAIFPGGTLKPGAQNNLPSDPGSIGAWQSRAVFLVNTEQFNGGVSPIAYATMLYQLPDDSKMLVSEGQVPNIGSSTRRAVIGGTGRFSGATGEVHHENIGTNGTGCFNYRFTFKLRQRTPREE